jgi:hypothetical protein
MLVRLIWRFIFGIFWPSSTKTRRKTRLRRRRNLAKKPNLTKGGKRNSRKKKLKPTNIVIALKNAGPRFPISILCVASYLLFFRDGKNVDYADSAEIDEKSLTIEESRYLGGDEAHTHLVKGLDYQMLRASRDKSEEDDETLDAYALSTPSLLSLMNFLQNDGSRSETERRNQTS